MKRFKAKPLPYTMGNAGDLIKHGMLCEVIEWLSKESNQNIRFYDPFGGRPWQSPIHPAIAERLSQLQSCPLKHAQNDPGKRYFGSGHIVKNLAEIYHSDINVYASDGDEGARDDLKCSGLDLISCDNFNPASAYSILACHRINETNSLILIDPFYDLKYINDHILPIIIDRVSNNVIAIVLYVLYADDEIELWERFKNQNEQLIPDEMYWHRLSCEAISDSIVAGEGKFHSSVSLYLNRSLVRDNVSKLTSALNDFVINLRAVIDNEVKSIHQ